MIASLPMYDWPEIQVYNDQFWKRLSKNLSHFSNVVPEQLTRSELHTQWQREDLFLSQTCAYPLVTELPKTTIVVGTPLYDVDFCSEGYYLSEFKNNVLAFNSQNSQSGFNALRSLLVDQEFISHQKSFFFSSGIQSESHRKSIELVANGQADICAVDPVSWALAQRYDEQTKKLRVLTLTEQTPALPLVTSAFAIPKKFDEEEWRKIIMSAFNQSLDDPTLKELLISGITFIPEREYFKLPISNLDIIK